jgi:hypothetical protein
LEIGKIDKTEQGEVSAWVNGSLCLFFMVCINLVACHAQVEYGSLAASAIVCFVSTVAVGIL